MLIRIRHVTTYTYDTSASYAIQSLRLTPSSFDGQQVAEWRIVCTLAGNPIELRDGFGNIVHLVTIRTPHQKIEIEAGGLVETQDRHGVVRGLVEPSPPRIYLRDTAQTRADDAIRELAAGAGAGDIIERLHALSAAVSERVQYSEDSFSTNAHPGASEALKAGKGIYQDFAHIFISAARVLAIPARYVTGYLLLDDGVPPPQTHHSWAEAWVEGLGWIGFDVANQICATDHYVRLAGGLDAGYAAPIRGSRRGTESERLIVAINVQQQTAQQ
jgi:transglutaminase-like putative cysteine protease